MTSSDFQRTVGWVTALRALRAHPGRWLFGWGPETFGAVYRLHRTQHAADVLGYNGMADHAHNLPLELLVTVGVVGAAAVVYLGWRLWRVVDDEGRACILGLLVVSMFEPIFFPPAAALFVLLGSRYRREELLFEEPAMARWGLWAAAVLTALCLGVWADDAFNPRRSLLLHPHESEANQLATMEALAHGQDDRAVFYARRAATADPMHRPLVAQEAQLEAAVTARRRALRPR